MEKSGRFVHFQALALVVACAWPSLALAQTGAGGRVSLTVQSGTASDAGASRTFSEIVTTVTFTAPASENGGAEFAFDFRGAASPWSSSNRASRISIYEAYAGYRLAGGRLGARVGQMWLSDLGALGAVGGFLAEYRQPKGTRSMCVRAGVFGGMEPKVLEAGYTSDVRKFGGYVALDGNGARRHVLGLVTIRHRDFVERSVVTATNFLPLGRQIFVYQAAEYDLAGPAGQGRGGLNYFFANGRYTPVRLVEVQGSYHRGRSIDARTITLDQINGRPVSQRALEGLLYESAGGRVWVSLTKTFRVYAGYARDRNNSEDRPTGRTNIGLFSSNLFGSGIDLSVSESRVHRPAGSYDSWDLSVGRSVTPTLYVSGGYNASLSVLRIVGTGGYLVESRPQTGRFLGSANIYLTRRMALLVNGERVRDGDLTEYRVMTNLSYRF